HPENANFQDNLARSRFDLAEAVLTIDPQAALNLFSAAGQDFKDLIDISPTHSDASTNLATSRLGQARALAALDRFEAALLQFEETHEFLVHYHDEHPDLHFGKRMLAETLCGMGE